MTNEELAERIQAGQLSLYAALWEQTEPLIRRMAQRYLTFHAPAGVELDDLVQTGFFALADAVRYYTPSKGWKLTTYLSCTAKRAFADVCGFRSGRSDATNRAASYDEPLRDEEDDFTLIDTLADENALEALEGVSERAFQEQLSRILRLALAELEPAERAFVIQRFYMNERRQDAELYLVELYGIPAESVRSYTARIFPKLRSGSYRRQLRELLDELVGTSYDTGAGSMTGGGLETFRRTGFSATESAALERIARENRKNKLEVPDEKGNH